jgi:hypothetical protein
LGSRSATAINAFELPEGARRTLLDGSWDSTAELLTNATAVKRTAARLPYVNGFSGA